MSNGKVTGPWVNPQAKRDQRWNVTVMRGDIVQTFRFATKAAATGFRRQLTATGKR